jgi:hypothetical protein
MQEATGLTGKARPCPERMIVRRDSSTLNPYTPAQAETHQPSPIVDPAYGTLASEVRGDGRLTGLQPSGPPARGPELRVRLVYDVQVTPRKFGYTLLRRHGAVA